MYYSIDFRQQYPIIRGSFNSVEEFVRSLTQENVNDIMNTEVRFPLGYNLPMPLVQTNEELLALQVQVDYAEQRNHVWQMRASYYPDNTDITKEYEISKADLKLRARDLTQAIRNAKNETAAVKAEIVKQGFKI